MASVRLFGAILGNRTGRIHLRAVLYLAERDTFRTLPKSLGEVLAGEDDIDGYPIVTRSFRDNLRFFVAGSVPDTLSVGELIMGGDDSPLLSTALP